MQEPWTTSHNITSDLLHKQSSYLTVLSSFTCSSCYLLHWSVHLLLTMTSQHALRACLKELYCQWKLALSCPVQSFMSLFSSTVTDRLRNLCLGGRADHKYEWTVSAPLSTSALMKNWCCRTAVFSNPDFREPLRSSPLPLCFIHNSLWKYPESLTCSRPVTQGAVKGEKLGRFSGPMTVREPSLPSK